jgi:EPS-associated MarR family transcriptional regulator
MPVSSEESSLQVLRLLEKNSQLTQRELAAELGVSLGKVNYCVQALLAKGFIKLQNFRGSRNKLAYAYLLTPAGIAAKSSLALSFLQIKMAEYERLQAEIEQLQREAEAVPLAGEPVNGMDVT